jgi:hypothetical protein
MEGGPPSKDFSQSFLTEVQRLIRADARFSQVFADEEEYR